eukprot:237684-Rhodomonas_salina.2
MPAGGQEREQEVGERSERESSTADWGWRQGMGGPANASGLGGALTGRWVQHERGEEERVLRAGCPQLSSLALHE